MELKNLSNVVYLASLVKKRAVMTYEVPKFKYSSKKWLLISPSFVIVLLQSETLFLDAVFQFLYIITALVFSSF